MSKRNSPKVSKSVVVPVVEVSETVLSDVLGPVVSEELSSEVSDTVSEVLEEVLNEVSSEPVSEVVETVPVSVPNHLLPNFQRWLSGTLTRKSNGGLTSNNKKLGRKPSVFTKIVCVIRLKGETTWRVNGRGRNPLFSLGYQITVPKELEVTSETRFNVNTETGDWSVVVPVTEEVQESKAA